MNLFTRGPILTAAHSLSYRRALQLLGLSGSLAAVAACGAAPPDPVTVHTKPGGSAGPDAPADAAPSILQVGWVATPAQPVIDGDIAEWGPLPEGAAVVLSATKDGGHLVASLSGASKDGVWILLSSAVDPLPELGGFSRDGSFYKHECLDSLEPAEAAACKEVVTRHAAFVAAREAEFERLFRLEKDGLRQVGKSGSLEPVPSAVVASKAKGEGMTVEVKLPLSAFPRFTQAPVSDLYLAAVPGPAAKAPKIEVEQRQQVMEGEGIRFEPYGELREMARTKVFRDGFSYHPSEPNVVEIVSYPDREFGGTHLDRYERVLWEPVAKLGDVEVGTVQLEDRYLGILKAGKVLDLVGQEGELMGHVERDGALHFFSWIHRPYNPTPAYWATWKIDVVDAAGAVSEPAEMEVLTSGWKSVSEVHTATFDRIGVRGEPYVYEGDEPEEPLEIALEYDKKKKAYVAGKRDLKSLSGPATTKSAGKPAAKPAAKTTAKPFKQKKP